MVDFCATETELETLDCISWICILSTKLRTSGPSGIIRILFLEMYLLELPLERVHRPGRNMKAMTNVINLIRSRDEDDDEEDHIYIGQYMVLYI